MTQKQVSEKAKAQKLAKDIRAAKEADEKKLAEKLEREPKPAKVIPGAEKQDIETDGAVLIPVDKTEEVQVRDLMKGDTYRYKSSKTVHGVKEIKKDKKKLVSVTVTVKGKGDYILKTPFALDAMVLRFK